MRAYLELLERLGDPLPEIKCAIAWERFRPLLVSVCKKGEAGKGVSLIDAVLMFTVLVLPCLAAE